MVFVVAGGTFESHCLPSMLDFDAICGVPEHLAMLHGYVIVCLRCLILMLFVVAGGTFRSHCFSSMLDFDVICRGGSNFWKSLLAFDA